MNGNETNSTQSRRSLAGALAAELHTNGKRSDRLLVRVNHEIRTALNVILGLTDVMRESELSGALSYNVSAVRSSAECLLKESAEIIDLIRAELGSLQLSSASFDLVEALHQAIELMSIIASCKRVSVKFRCTRHAALYVYGDPARLCQILTTLVRASIDRLEQGEVQVYVDCSSDYVEGVKLKVRVSDNGRVIPKEKLDRMFDFKFDGDNTPEDRSNLAFVLAVHLARLMDGDLWAEQDLEMGAAFLFNVTLRPVAISDLLQLSKIPTPPRADRRPLKILVADDSADTVLLIRAFLKDVPWGVETAENGRAALEMAVNKSYDLILMDLDMPEMNGYSATRQIRASECLQQKAAVPIVALTAHNEAEAASRSIEAGCTAHVTKPIRKAALMETIQKYATDREREPVRI